MDSHAKIAIVTFQIGSHVVGDSSTEVQKLGDVTSPTKKSLRFETSASTARMRRQILQMHPRRRNSAAEAIVPNLRDQNVEMI